MSALTAPTAPATPAQLLLQPMPLAAHRAVVPEAWQQFLAFDFGVKRTGVASGNRLIGAGQALPTIHAEANAARLDAAAALIAQWQPQALVVGIPTHPDGAAHDNTARALRFARQLHARCGLAVYGVDERYSSVEAHARGARDADAGAACVILERFFEEIAP